MMSKMQLLVVAVLIVVCINQSAPVWPSQFTIDFAETATLVTKGSTKGTIYYDAKNNRQVVYRQNGGYDRYCGTVFKFTTTPCNHIIVDNKRYLDFPQKQYCCFCCDGAHGCGVTAPDWMVKSGAKYVGREQLDPNGPYIKWDIRGGQDNLYYHKDDDIKTPRRLYQVPEDLMDFSNYRLTVDASKFTLPSYCKDKCGATTICAGLRGEKNLVQTEAQ